MGDHGLLGKCVMYEESVRVPLIVRAPWLAHTARRVAQPVSLVDLVPTLLDLLDQPVPAHLQGRSRAAYLHGRPPPDEDVFIEWNGDNARGPSKIKQPLVGTERARVFSPWRGIVSPDGWKLNLSPVDQGELYDLKRDPHELDNRYGDSVQRGRARDLAARVATWQARTGDSMPLPELT
jgi:arylsulfatase A-like enzyme